MVFNTRVGIDLSLNDLASQFDATFLSIGTWKESWLYLPGTELTGVYPALPFLESMAKNEQLALGATRSHHWWRQRGNRFGANRKTSRR